MTRCKNVQDELLLRLDETLPGELIEHLNGCPQCKKYYDDLLRSRKLLISLPTQPPPPALEEKIIRRLNDMKNETLWQRFIAWFSVPRRIKPAWGLLALILILLASLGISQIIWPRDSFRQDKSADLYYAAAPKQLAADFDNLTLRSAAVAEEGALGGEKIGTSAIDRKVIFTGFLEVEVNSPEEAQDWVLDYVQRMGGFVAESRRSLLSSDQVQIRMVLRIPATGFDNALAELSRLGKVTDKNLQGQDITEQYYDLETRLQTKIKQEERYLEILETAHSVEDVLKVERELGRIRTEIESMEGTMRYYKDRTDFATITISLKEPAKISVGGFTIRNIFKEIGEAFLRNVQRLLVFIGSLAPWLVLLAIIILVAVFVRRKSH